jgi:hypothetical protein
MHVKNVALLPASNTGFDIKKEFIQNYMPCTSANLFDISDFSITTSFKWMGLAMLIK